MQERDKKGDVSLEKHTEELVEYIENAEFDTPEFMAISSYLDLQNLTNNLSRETKKVFSSQDEEEKFSWEKQVDRTNIKMALLEHEIRYNESHVQGFASAYTHLTLGIETLRELALREARSRFPDNQQLQNVFIESAYVSFTDDARDIIIGTKTGDEPELNQYY